MKTLHFVSILVLAAATTFACDDDGDRLESASAGSAGKASAAGSGGKAGAAGMSNHAGTGGASAGAGGNAGAMSEAGAGGGAGTNEGGAAGGGVGGGGAGGESGEGGAAGTGVVGGAAGESGAGGEGGEGVQARLEIIGSWNDNFTGPMTITATSWAGSAIVGYDNTANAVYTQWPADNAWTPNKFAKTLYTEVQNDSFYYCMVVFSADTLEDALADTTVPDLSDPDHTGCGGTFPWSKATKQ